MRQRFNHRIAACRTLGWSEIDALVIEDASHLQSELMEIDENLCRAELTASQRTGYTKRSKQIWEALHPTPKMSSIFVAVFGQELADSAVLCDENGVPIAGELEVGQVVPPQVSTHGGARPQTQGFAAATSVATGQSKRETNRAIARANALGDDLQKLEGTSLDKGVVAGNVDASESCCGFSR